MHKYSAEGISGNASSIGLPHTPAQLHSLGSHEHMHVESGASLLRVAYSKTSHGRAEDMLLPNTPLSLPVLPSQRQRAIYHPIPHP